MQWEVPDGRVLVELQTSTSARKVVPGEQRSDNWMVYPNDIAAWLARLAPNIC
jgi:hypothetical protein